MLLCMHDYVCMYSQSIVDKQCIDFLLCILFISEQTVEHKISKTHNNVHVVSKSFICTHAPDHNTHVGIA